MKKYTPEEQEQFELAQIKQRNSPYHAKHIGQSIRRIMARTGLGQTQAAMEIQNAWSEAAGPRLAACTQPGKISRGVLLISARDSSALQEFSLCRRELLEKMQKALPHAGIQALRGRIGS